MQSNTEPVPAVGRAWVKSSYSGNNGNCVEVAALPRDGRAVRDSKDPHGPVLAFGLAGFHAFLSGVASESLPPAR
ncbi:DUF397 domain-containing protein [Streptomyces montanisoli]|uniref:DUF397 domain-containing protein n=1 Tax=Streptomyces montanisoli TaxID=2798581 RepID=A0A940MCR7_9ACTN|nr:DUF397 domain-containing protein [Streptomyces montanisoli]MBP0456661.1 DUF397 domain-containing protein [Streptomyces montanisoli]